MSFTQDKHLLNALDITGNLRIFIYQITRAHFDLTVITKSLKQISLDKFVHLKVIIQFP